MDIAEATDRQELIEIYDKKYKGNPADLQEISSMDALRSAVREQKKVFENYKARLRRYNSYTEEDFKGLLEKYDISYDDKDLEDRDFAGGRLDMAIEREKRAAENSSITDYLDAQESDIAISDAAFHLQKLKENSGTEVLDIDTKNTMTAFENVIRAKFGLASKPLELTDDDLNALLLLDDFQVGTNCQEYLASLPPAIKDRTGKRLHQAVILRNAKLESAEREKNYLLKCQAEYAALKTEPEKIVFIDDKPEISDTWLKWREDLKSFFRQLELKRLAYTSMTEKPNGMKDFEKIFKGVENLVNNL